MHIGSSSFCILDDFSGVASSEPSGDCWVVLQIMSLWQPNHLVNYYLPVTWFTKTAAHTSFTWADPTGLAILVHQHAEVTENVQSKARISANQVTVLKLLSSNYCKVLKEKVMLCINFLVVSTLCSAPWKFKEQGPVGPPYEKGLVKSIKHFCRSYHHANIDVHMVWDHTSTSRISKCRLTHDFRGSHTTGTTQNRMLDVKMYYMCFFTCNSVSSLL